MSDNVPAKLSEFQIAEIDGNMLEEVIETNIGDDVITRFDLDSLQVPTGGGTKWEVPTLEGDITQEKVTGIIIHWKEVRTYWEDDYASSGGGTPPDCYSDDARIGIGNPGGKCSECPFSQWGSSEDGQGQACKKMRILFLLRENDILPLAITAPPTSVQSVKKYFMRLASKGIPFYGAITSLGLEKAVNKGGIEYSKIKPAYETTLSREEMEKAKEIREKVKPKLEQVTVEEGVDSSVLEDDGYELES